MNVMFILRTREKYHLYNIIVLSIFLLSEKITFATDIKKMFYKHSINNWELG